MSTNRGIFESFPNPPGTRQDSPFAVVQEPAAEAAPASPFAAVRQDSPFTVVEDGTMASSGEFGRPVKLPERRKVDSPFQVAEPTEGFGFEAPARTVAPSPFETAAAPAPAASPFSAPPQAAPASPFAVAETPRPAASPATQAAIAAFAQWPEPTIAAPAAPAPAPAAFAAPAHVPAAFAAAPEPAAQATAPFQAAAPAVQAPAPAAAPAQPFDESQSDSFNIRQLELRAIFGVDREMNADEILQRSRALPGMRNIARVAASDMATIEAIKNLLPNLGFGSGALKLYSGSVPLEFIREGGVMLAVQTDGGYAPGVRETLMIVARELSRLG